MPTEVIFGCLMLLAVMLFLNIAMLVEIARDLKGIRHAIMCVHWDIYESKFTTTKNDA